MQLSPAMALTTVMRKRASVISFDIDKTSLSWFGLVLGIVIITSEMRIFRFCGDVVKKVPSKQRCLNIRGETDPDQSTPPLSGI